MFNPAEIEQTYILNLHLNHIKKYRDAQGENIGQDVTDHAPPQTLGLDVGNGHKDRGKEGKGIKGNAPEQFSLISIGRYDRP